MHGMYSVFIWYLSVDVGVCLFFLFFFTILKCYTCEKDVLYNFFVLQLANVKGQQRSRLSLSTSLFLLLFS